MICTHTPLHHTIRKASINFGDFTRCNTKTKVENRAIIAALPLEAALPATYFQNWMDRTGIEVWKDIEQSSVHNAELGMGARRYGQGTCPLEQRRERGAKGASAPGGTVQGAEFGRAKMWNSEILHLQLSVLFTIHTNAIVVTTRISIRDLIAGGATTKTFASGGKHPRAATALKILQCFCELSVTAKRPVDELLFYALFSQPDP